MSSTSSIAPTSHWTSISGGVTDGKWIFYSYYPKKSP